jgi:organic radical activating enzyme
MIAGFEVQVETNGSLWINDFPVFNPLLTIVCSPKTPTINPNILKYADAFKYVVRAGDTDEETGLPTNVLGSGLRAAAPPTGVYENGRGGRAFEVYVQGEEDIRSEAQTSANIFHAVRIAMQFGYRVSLQMHKILGLM